MKIKFKEINPEVVVGEINNAIRIVTLIKEDNEFYLYKIIPKEYICRDYYDDFCLEIENKLDELNRKIIKQSPCIDASKLKGNITKEMFILFELDVFDNRSSHGYEELCRSFKNIQDAISYAKSMSKFFSKRDPLLWARYERMFNIDNDIKNGLY